MRISKRQLRILIREVKGSTKKYDEDSALKGGQSNLPDALQKGIIDKAVEDREDREEEDREERNESVKITKRHLRRIVKEELAGVSEEGDDIVDGYYNAILELISNEWGAAAIDLTAPDGIREVDLTIQALKNLIADLESGQF
jgi:hypothetical protein